MEETTKYPQVETPWTVPPYFDENSQTWRAVEELIVTLLADARKRNDSFHNTPDQTAAIRGEIRLLKRLQRIPEEVRKGRIQRPQIPRHYTPGEE